MKMNNNKLFPRQVAVVLFYDKNLNILVQKRKSHSKVGELYGFFGGEIEVGETSDQALRRELIEELNYKSENLVYWGKYSFLIDLPESKHDKEIRFGELFFSPITPELLGSNIEDDTEKILLPIDKILENRKKEFGPVKFNDAVKIKQDIINLVKTSGDQ